MRIICSRSSILTVIAVGATAFAINGCGGGASSETSPGSSKPGNTERTNTLSSTAPSNTDKSLATPMSLSAEADAKPKSSRERRDPTLLVGGQEKLAEIESNEISSKDSPNEHTDHPTKESQTDADVGEDLPAGDELVEKNAPNPDDELAVAESDEIQAKDDSSEPSLRDWLNSLELDVPSPVPFHMCDGLKTLSWRTSSPNSFPLIKWQAVQRALLEKVNYWLRGNSETVDWEDPAWNLYVDGETVMYFLNKGLFGELTQRYVLKFVKTSIEFENLRDNLENKDLFELEWIKFKRGLMDNEAHNNMRQRILPHTVVKNGKYYIVLPKENMLSLIRTVNWCSEKNELEAKFFDENNSEFVDLYFPEEILKMERKGLKEPVPETKTRVLRFYKWIVNYIESLINRTEELPLNDDGFLVSVKNGNELLEFITNRNFPSKFVIERPDLKSELDWSVVGIWTSYLIRASGEKRVRYVNEILKEAIIQFEENNARGNETLWRPKSYGDVMRKAVYMFVAEMVNADTPSDVPKDYFKNSITKRQFIGVMKKFKQVILEVALQMSKELGQSDNLQPKALPWHSKLFPMDTVGERIVDFLTRPGRA